MGTVALAGDCARQHAIGRSRPSHGVGPGKGICRLPASTLGVLAVGTLWHTETGGSGPAEEKFAEVSGVRACGVLTRKRPKD